MSPRKPCAGIAGTVSRLPGRAMPSIESRLHAGQSRRVFEGILPRASRNTKPRVRGILCRTNWSFRMIPVREPPKNTHLFKYSKYRAKCQWLLSTEQKSPNKCSRKTISERHAAKEGSGRCTPGIIIACFHYSWEKTSYSANITQRDDKESVWQLYLSPWP